VLPNANKADEFHAELTVIAEVLVYYEVASRRVFDVIPMIIEHQFLVGFSNTLWDTLLDELGFNGKNGRDKCRCYAVDNPEITNARKELEGNLTILVQAIDILNQFWDFKVSG
jgi:hypothetical protein